MPLPDQVRDLLEQNIQDNFAKVEITRPPTHVAVVEFEPTFIADKTYVYDPSRQLRHDFTYKSPTVMFSYPTEDIPVLGFNGMYLRKSSPPQVDFKRADEIPFTHDLVNDANYVEIEFDPTNPFEFLEIYTSRETSDSTSRLKVTFYDKKENIIGKLFLFNSDIKNGGWTKIVFGVKWFDINESGNFKIKIQEYSMGASPDGIRIWKNVAGDSLIRTYYKKISKKYGFLKESIMRIDVYSKSKNIGIGDNTEEFVPADVITSEIARHIRNHILRYWFKIQTDPTFNPNDIKSGDGFGLHELRGGGSDAEFRKTEVIAHSWLDIALYYEDGYIIESEPLRNIIIQDIKLTTQLI